MTREEMNRILNQQYQDLAEEFQRLNVPIGGITSVTVNGRLKTTMGRCFHSYVPYTGITTHRIEINKECFTNPDVLRDTLAHEMCHAIVGTQGHGPVWKKWAGVVNRHLGTHITTKFSYSAYGLEPVRAKCREPKYTVVCPHCGGEWKRSRKCKLTEHPERYLCGVCGAHLELKK